MRTLLEPGEMSSSYCCQVHVHHQGCSRRLNGSLFTSCVCMVSILSWKAPRYILSMPVVRHDRVRKKYHILVEGEGIPPPIKSFREMKLPQGNGKPRGNLSPTDLFDLPVCQTHGHETKSLYCALYFKSP